jgi:hypothetical protein
MPEIDIAWFCLAALFVVCVFGLMVTAAVTNARTEREKIRHLQDRNGSA